MNGEVAVQRGSHSDVIETPGLEGRIEIDATEAEPTVRVPEDVGVAYAGNDDLAADGGAITDESRIRQVGWSPTKLQRDASMWGGGLLLVAAGDLFSGTSGSDMAAVLALLGGAGLLYLGHKAAAAAGGAE